MKNSEASETAAADNRWKPRRSYVVNPAFQWKYALMVALTIFVISSIMSTALYGVLHRQARLRTMQPEAYVADVTLVILASGVAFSVLTAAGVGLWSFLVTHRICGPLSVISRHLAELSEGRFPDVRPLRKKDEFKDFYAVFRCAVEALEARKEMECAALTEALRLARSGTDGDDDTRRRVIAELTSQLRDMQAEATRQLGGKVGAPPSPPASAERELAEAASAIE